MLKSIQEKARHRTRPLWAWLKLLWQRINEDNMTTLAGNLAYVSLLSLVPLVAVVFALFAAFPMFSDVSIQLRHFIFANFLPATGDVIQQYIEQFVANSNKMTAVGACGLIVTALLLMYSIDSALNAIWRSKRVRPKIYSFAVYWMILTLGPLLAGASRANSSYLLSLRWARELSTVLGNAGCTAGSYRRAAGNLDAWAGKRRLLPGGFINGHWFIGEKRHPHCRVR